MFILHKQKYLIKKEKKKKELKNIMCTVLSPVNLSPRCIENDSTAINLLLSDIFDFSNKNSMTGNLINEVKKSINYRFITTKNNLHRYILFNNKSQIRDVVEIPNYMQSKNDTQIRWNGKFVLWSDFISKYSL